MRVLYDISVLANGFAKNISRTGVFRVVEEISKVLSTATEVDLLLYTNKETISYAKRYLESTRHFRSDNLVESKPINGVPLCFLKSLISLDHYLTGQLDRTTSLILNHEKYPIRLKIQKRIVSTPLNLVRKLIADMPAIRMSQVDIFHSTFYNTPLDWVASQKTSIVQSIYDLTPIIYPEFFDTRIYAERLNKIIQQLGRGGNYICNSESTKNDLLNHFVEIEPQRVFITPLAASALFFPNLSKSMEDITRKQYGIPADSNYILSVATLEPRKNLSRLVKCFKNVIQSEKTTDFYLVLAGELGWNNTMLLQEINHDPQLRKYIILTGYVDNKELNVLYSGATAFVYPSLYEGFGLPPLEAMQCGAPVIVSNTSSLPEVVGDAGMLIDPLDTDALSQSILKLYNNEELRHEMSKKSIERAKCFSWEKTAGQTIDVYRKTLEMK